MKSLIVLLFLGLIFGSNTLLANKVTQIEKNFAVFSSPEDKVIQEVISDVTIVQSDFVISNVSLAEKVRQVLFICPAGLNSIYVFPAKNYDVGKKTKIEIYNKDAITKNTHESFRRSRDGLIRVGQSITKA